MNINYKQPQFELFPGSSDGDAVRPRYLLANLTLTSENVVVLAILGIMVAVFAYSLGVERGKRVMASEFRRMAMTAPDTQTPAANASATASTIAVPHPTAVAGSNAAVPVVGKPAAAAAVASPVAAPKPATGTSTFKYTIQVASYADGKFAQRAAGELNKNGFETLVLQKGKYAILCVGKFNQKNEAMSVLSKLKAKYKDCLVRSM